MTDPAKMLTDSAKTLLAGHRLGTGGLVPPPPPYTYPGKVAWRCPPPAPQWMVERFASFEGGQSMRVGVLVRNRDICGRLRMSLRSCSGAASAPSVHFSLSWGDLLTQAEAGRWDLVLVDPSLEDRTGLCRPDVPALEGLASVLGRDAIILFSSGQPPLPPEFRALGMAGFPYLVRRGVDDDTCSLLRILARARGRRSLRSGLGWVGPDQTEEESRALLLEALTAWPPVLTASALAEHVALSRRTLERRLRHAGFPSPGRSIALGRFLEASMLRIWGVQNRSRIAATLGMNGSDALAHLCARVTGHPLGEMWSEKSDQDPVRWTLKEIRREQKSA